MRVKARLVYGLRSAHHPFQIAIRVRQISTEQLFCFRNRYALLSHLTDKADIFLTAIFKALRFSESDEVMSRMPNLHDGFGALNKDKFDLLRYR